MEIIRNYYKGGELASPRWWFPTFLGKEGVCGFGVGDIGCINDAKLECHLFNVSSDN